MVVLLENITDITMVIRRVLVAYILILCMTVTARTTTSTGLSPAGLLVNESNDVYFIYCRILGRLRPLFYEVRPAKRLYKQNWSDWRSVSA